MESGAPTRWTAGAAVHLGAGSGLLRLHPCPDSSSAHRPSAPPPLPRPRIGRPLSQAVAECTARWYEDTLKVGAWARLGRVLHAVLPEAPPCILHGAAVASRPSAPAPTPAPAPQASSASAARCCSITRAAWPPPSAWPSPQTAPWTTGSRRRRSACTTAPPLQPPALPARSPQPAACQPAARAARAACWPGAPAGCWRATASWRAACL